MISIADQQCCVFEQDVMNVHAVQWDSSQDSQVVVDSGSDASCLPLSWANVGSAGTEDPNSFKGAQAIPSQVPRLGWLCCRLAMSGSKSDGSCRA